VRDRLVAANLPNLDPRIKELTRGVFPIKAELVKLIADRKAAFDANGAAASPEAGGKIFTKNCAVCHQIGGHGGVVGPQLDGVAKRGIDRMLEDILDPNRNVDPAFRYSIVTLKDGNVITGLEKREEGNVLVFVDSLGKEVRVDKNQIRKRFESSASLMPSNFGEILTESDLNSLLKYLISKQ
jgi:putative heme-binding domain-containing protein